MAITTSTFTVNAGWAKSSIITQMETAMTSLGWNDGTQTGQIIGLGTFFGGGTKELAETYYDIRQKSTSGVGTDASFYVYRDALNVRYILINRPGYGYTGGELVVLDGDSIGGISSGAADLSFKVCVNETLSGGTTGTASTIRTGQVDYVNDIYKFRFSGNDRNGAIGAGQTIMVVNEGDVVSIANTNNSSYYPTLAFLLSPLSNNTSGSYSPETGQIAGIAPTISLGTTSVFRPKIGQAGTYVFKIQNNNLGGIGHTLGQLIIQPWDGSGTRTPVGVGSTSTFLDKQLSGASPWGVQKHQIQAGKRYGSTYRGFVEYTAGYLDIVTFNGYSSYSGGEYYGNTDTLNQTSFTRHGGTADKRRMAGAPNLDFPGYYTTIINTGASFESNANITQYNARLAQINHGTNTGYILDLNLFKSGLDPRFVVFSYKSPNLSSTHLTGNTFDTWFFHNFTTNLWNLDHVFLGGLTQIIPVTGNTENPRITFRTYLTNLDSLSSASSTKRSAEFPYSEYRGYGQTNSPNYVDWIVQGNAYPQDTSTQYARMYYRSSDNPLGFTGYNDIDITPQGRISPDANFNAAIKGLPLNGQLLPVPYYMPDDFVLIQFHYTSPSANIQQGDTITISGSEVYTVITGSYNQTTNTRGILFCARTV